MTFGCQVVSKESECAVEKETCPTKHRPPVYNCEINKDLLYKTKDRHADN